MIAFLFMALAALVVIYVGFWFRESQKSRDEQVGVETPDRAGPTRSESP